MLARHPGREGLRRDHRQLVRAVHQAARRRRVARARGRPGRVRAQALRDPPRGRAGRRAGPRDPVVLEPHDRLQGHAHGAAAAGLLPRPAGRADQDRAGARPLALLDEHVPELGARAPVPARSPTTARSTRCAATSTGCARASRSSLRAVRRRPREGAAGRPPRRLGLGDVRQRARAARARRPQPPARADDDGAGGVGGARRPARPPAGVLRVPLVRDGAVGRAGGDLLHRRPRDRRDARPQRAAPGPLDGDEGRLGRARVGVRRARRAGRERAAQGPPAAGQAVPRRPRRGPHRRRRRGQGARRHPAPVRRVVREGRRPARRPARAPGPRPARAAAHAPARVRLHAGGPAGPARADGGQGRGADRLDGQRPLARGALRPVAAAVLLLQAAVRAGHEPADRPDPRVGRDVDPDRRRLGGEPAHRGARPRPPARDPAPDPAQRTSSRRCAASTRRSSARTRSRSPGRSPTGPRG